MKSLLGKLRTDTKNQYLVPTSIQAVFTFSVLISFLLQMAYMAYNGIRQYGENPEMGGYYSYFVTAHALPALLFLIAYAMNQRKLSQLSRSFESLLLAGAALTIWSAFMYIDPTVFIGHPTRNYIESYATYQIVSSAVMVVLYTGALYWLRRSKRWA